MIQVKARDELHHENQREESLSTTLYWFALASDGKWLWASAVGHPETETSEIELPLEICEDDPLLTPAEFSPKLLCAVVRSPETAPKKMALVSSA